MRYLVHVVVDVAHRMASPHGALHLKLASLPARRDILTNMQSFQNAGLLESPPSKGDNDWGIEHV